MILLLSTSDTDLLSARHSGGDYRLANPSRVEIETLPELLDGVDAVVIRLLGGYQAWPDGIEAIRRAGLPMILVGGEQEPDPELMAGSTVPGGIVGETHQYLAHGGTGNLAELARFLSDSLTMTGLGFEPPAPTPTWGYLDIYDGSEGDTSAPKVAIVYYRAHHLAGNTDFVTALAEAVTAAGAVPVPIFAASLRNPEEGLLEALSTVDAMVVTVNAAGGTLPADAGAGGSDDGWDIGPLAALDIPILQGLVPTSSRAAWLQSDDGLSPMDAATQVAIPEFDGRIITVPFAFKEIDADGLMSYRPDSERAARLAAIATNYARLRHTPVADRRIVVMLSAYPTKHARIGNAVGLDTPVSTVRLLTALREAGYDIGTVPGVPDGDRAEDGDALIHALIAAGGQDENWLTAEQLETNPIRISAADYRAYFDTLDPALREAVIGHWGPPPGSLYVDDSVGGDGDIVLAALASGNTVVMIQPPRGFGANPVAIYHDPDLPPSHHYLAAYRWIREQFGAHAIVHMGKHGNLEWLPGKQVGLSASCAADAAIADTPMIYPFLVNDPGEGTQAKRRVHATIIDHLVPPMARAESYGDIARLEQLMDEHANIAALDPPKLPAIRAQIWTLIQAAKLDADLGLDDRPDDDAFDDFLLHVDGWICEIKDVQIRDGLHVLSQAPTGRVRVDLMLAILRSRQMWAGHAEALPGLREALGYAEGSDDKHGADEAEARADRLVTAMEQAGWPTDRDAIAAAVAAVDARAAASGDVINILRFAATEVAPRLAGTDQEIPRILHALDGGYIPAGPSGSPLRGLVNVLPTGRNFYSVDPRSIPSPLAWETGRAMADSLLERYVADTGALPETVGLSMWGTAAMRTSGDDIAEVLALLGIRPRWDEASRRVTGIEPIPLGELGRPRIDVTLRISGFFRDAFPHVVTLLDDAVALAADQDEPDADNFVRAHVQRDLAEHGDRRRATTRIFGSKPGSYGAGLMQVIDARNWRDDADLAEVYAAWGGFAYGRGLDGREARADMETAYRRIAVAVHNTDSLEHDIADADDYFQYHGGMIATVRSLTGASPRAYIGDSTRPDSVRTRSLDEATARVFRARVVNPRWIDAMKRHGYKGAFELAATVDYLFGYDATAGVINDWMYEKLTDAYVRDPAMQEFFDAANPWALHGIAERLLEAVDRGMWAEPSDDALDLLREVYLRTEGDLEDR